MWRMVGGRDATKAVLVRDCLRSVRRGQLQSGVRLGGREMGLGTHRVWEVGAGLPVCQDGGG